MLERYSKLEIVLFLFLFIVTIAIIYNLITLYVNTNKNDEEGALNKYTVLQEIIEEKYGEQIPIDILKYLDSGFFARLSNMKLKDSVENIKINGVELTRWWGDNREYINLLLQKYAYEKLNNENVPEDIIKYLSDGFFERGSAEEELKISGLEWEGKLKKAYNTYFK